MKQYGRFNASGFDIEVMAFVGEHFGKHSIRQEICVSACMAMAFDMEGDVAAAVGGALLQAARDKGWDDPAQRQAECAVELLRRVALGDDHGNLTELEADIHAFLTEIDAPATADVEHV